MYSGDGRRQLRRRRRRVVGDRDAAERADHLGQHRLVERDAGDREAGRERRMRVDHRLGVGPQLVDRDVHLQLRRRVPLAADLAAGEVGDHHHVGRHEALRDAGRRGQDAVGVEADADVAVVRGDEAAGPQAPPELDDVLAELRLRAGTSHGPCVPCAAARDRRRPCRGTSPSSSSASRRRRARRSPTRAVCRSRTPDP